MNRHFVIIFLMLLVVGALGCSQVYYTKSFRLATEDPADAANHLNHLIDGPLGEFRHSQLFFRVVALYESNNKAKMNQNSFNVMLEQRMTKGEMDTIVVDSVVFTIRPSGERRVLQRQRLLVYQGDYSPQPRIRSTFGSIEIPSGVDTVLVNFEASGGSGGTTPEKKQFALSLIRFEGSVKKLGVQPKDEL